MTIENSTPENVKSDPAIESNATYQPAIFSSKGRIGRLRYLAYSLLVLVIMLVGGFIGGLTGSSVGMVFVFIASIGAFAYGILLSKRRFNDMDKSGWFTILSIIPIVNIGVMLWLTFGRGNEGDNRFGPMPCSNSMPVKIIGGAAAAVIPLAFIGGIVAAVAVPQYAEYQERAAEAQSSYEQSIENASSD